MPAPIRLCALSEVVQAATEWRGGPVRGFTTVGGAYGARGVLDDGADENRAGLGGVKTGVPRFAQACDGGDIWDHVAALEKAEPVRPGHF